VDDCCLLVSRKQQKTRKVVETVDNSLLSITEDSIEQYMDADLTEYSSSRPEQKTSSSEQPPPLEKPTEVQPQIASSGQSVDVAHKVDLPEGL